MQPFSSLSSVYSVRPLKQTKNENYYFKKGLCNCPLAMDSIA